MWVRFLYAGDMELADDFITLKVAAKLSHTTVRRLRYLIETGRVNIPVREGRLILVSEAEVEREVGDYIFDGLPEGYIPTAKAAMEMNMSPNSALKWFKKNDIPSIRISRGKAWYGPLIAEKLEDQTAIVPRIRDGWSFDAKTLAELERIYS